MGRGLTHIVVAAMILVCISFMGSTSSQPESQPWEPIRLCGTLSTMVVPAERYVEQLWAALTRGSTTTGISSMKDEAMVKNTIKALSPSFVAVHGPTGTRKSTACVPTCNHTLVRAG